MANGRRRLGERSKLRFVAAPLSFDPIAEARRQWEEHWGHEPAPSMVAVTSIMRAQQIVMARLNELLDPLDLTFPRYEALMLLYYSRNGALPLGKISDRLQVHRASVTNVIDKLADRGYVERVGHERDRRAILARITKEGRRVARQATKRLNSAEFGTAPLGTEACEEIFALLEPLRVAEGDFVTQSPESGPLQAPAPARTD
jgi:DNA-binding MarR family transcriptional regulator